MLVAIHPLHAYSFLSVWIFPFGGLKPRKTPLAYYSLLTAVFWASSVTNNKGCITTCVASLKCLFSSFAIRHLGPAAHDLPFEHACLKPSDRTHPLREKVVEVAFPLAVFHHHLPSNRYSWGKILSSIIVTLGVCVATLAEARTKQGSNALTTSGCCDGVPAETRVGHVATGLICNI